MFMRTSEKITPSYAKGRNFRKIASTTSSTQVPARLKGIDRYKIESTLQLLCCRVRVNGTIRMRESDVNKPLWQIWIWRSGRSPTMPAERQPSAGNEGGAGVPEGRGAGRAYLGRAAALRGPAPSTSAPPHASEGGAGGAGAEAPNDRLSSGSPPFELFCAVFQSAATGGARRCGCALLPTGCDFPGF